MLGDFPIARDVIFYSKYYYLKVKREQKDLTKLIAKPFSLGDNKRQNYELISIIRINNRMTDPFFTVIISGLNSLMQKVNSHDAITIWHKV